jgi:hypothetical protein
MHLTDEQFEDVLRSPGSHAEHLAACEDCRRVLGEHEALRLRLQRGFASVMVPQGLVDRIAAQAHGQAQRGQNIGLGPNSGGSPRIRRPYFIFRWPVMAAAAAILIAAVTIGFMIWSPQSANAAQSQLVRIHQANLSGEARMFASGEPGQLKEYLQSQMKESIPIVNPSQGMKLQGCCVARFKDKDAASYLVKTDQGSVSIIILKESPQALGMKQMAAPDFWSAASDNCNMAAAHCPCGHFFYAVGEAPTSTLVNVLAQVRANCCSK